MADIIDQANEQELLQISVALASRKTTTLPFIGACHYCDEKLQHGNFCAPECRDDWEKEQKIKALRGYAA